MEFQTLSNDDLYKIMVQARVDYKKKFPLPEPVKEEVRRRAKQDLFFLAKYFIGFGGEINHLIMESTHRRVCDLFVKKDASKEIGEQDDRKERLLLYPRGSFKSTIDNADTVQWVLNFPDIRILFLTAADDLAVSFLDEAKKQFVINLEDLSFMNLFFPEFCVAEDKLGNAYEFTTPMRKIERKEPTIMASSIGSTLSGFHFDVIKADDAVSNKNSESEEQCQKVTKNFHINRKMLMAFGYLDLIGTRYDDMDLYGDAIEKNVGELKTERGPCWELVDNLSTGFRILIGRGVVVKPEFVEKGITFADATEEQCDLIFPEYLTFAFLKKEYHKDEISFEGQINQNPRQKVNAVFDKALLLKHTVPYTQIPVNGLISITWDFAFSRQKGRDYSTASVVMHNDKAQMFVVDLVRERFTPNALAKKVVELAARWRPFVIGIERASGSDFLEGSIIAEAKKLDRPEVLAVCSKIDWFTPDQQKDAKRTRMASLHPWLVNDQLFFAAHLQHLEVLYDEFGRCLSSHHHDDIPDVISQQPRYAPRVALMIEKKEIQTWNREDAAWNLLFEENCDEYGRPGMGYVPPVDLGPPVPDSPPAESSHPDLPPMLGSGLTG